MEKGFEVGDAVFISKDCVVPHNIDESMTYIIESIRRDVYYNNSGNYFDYSIITLEGVFGECPMVLFTKIPKVISNDSVSCICGARYTSRPSYHLDYCKNRKLS